MELKLKAEPRAGGGKGEARKLRAIGKVPGILYGHGMEPVALSVDDRELYHVLHTGAGSNVLVDLQVNGAEHLVLAREIQRNNIRGQLLHVDFLAIRRDEKITVDVPIRIVGESVGVKQGGVVEHHLWDLHLECLPGDVPEGIDADITSLDIDESLYVKDVPVPDAITVLTDLEEMVVSVVQPQVLELPEEAEAAEAEAEEAAEEGEAPAEGEAPGTTAEGSSDRARAEEGGEG